MNLREKTITVANVASTIICSKGVSVVVDLLFIIAHINCGGSVFGPCFDFSTLYLCLSSFAIILMGKRELVA